MQGVLNFKNAREQLALILRKTEDQAKISSQYYIFYFFQVSVLPVDRLVQYNLIAQY